MQNVLAANWYSAVAVLISATIVPLTTARAGAVTVAFPSNYQSGVLYNVVDREDREEIHAQWTSREACAAAKAGRPLPMGTVITSVGYQALLDSEGNPIRDAKGSLQKGELLRFTVMQKRPGGGAQYPESLRNGDWEFAAFTAEGKYDTQADIKGCMECHKPHDEIDFVKTYFAMAGKRIEVNPAPIPAGAAIALVARFAVKPEKLIVHAGTPVTWINADDVPHQFLVEGGRLKTDYLLKGQTGTVVLKEPGVYHYSDTFYPATNSLHGVLEVQ